MYKTSRPNEFQPCHTTIVVYIAILLTISIYHVAYICMCFRIRKSTYGFYETLNMVHRWWWSLGNHVPYTTTRMMRTYIYSLRERERQRRPQMPSGLTGDTRKARGCLCPNGECGSTLGRITVGTRAVRVTNLIEALLYLFVLLSRYFSPSLSFTFIVAQTVQSKSNESVPCNLSLDCAHKLLCVTL